MASSPITSWQIDGETMETVTDFIFLGSKITADGDCSHENSGLKSLKIDWFDSLKLISAQITTHPLRKFLRFLENSNLLTKLFLMYLHLFSPFCIVLLLYRIQEQFFLISQKGN